MLSIHRMRLPLALFIACLTAVIGFGQDYRFKVLKMDVELTVNPDASLGIHYEIDFENDPNGRVIDIVDIGLPHDEYNIQSMRARVNDSPVAMIGKSEYINTGVEVHLGRGMIPPGQRGTFVFDCVMPDMVYQDTTDRERAALQFVPTWFDPQAQVSNTHLRIGVHLPPSVNSDEVKYHKEETRYQTLVTTGEGEKKHVVALWEYHNQWLSDQNPKIGISFPKRVMQRVITMNSLQLLIKWFRENPKLRLITGVITIALFAVTFLRFSHATGWVLLLALGAGLSFAMHVSPGFQLLTMPSVAALFGLNERALRRRRTSYLPAIATVEGGGIRRGLTAPQAAVLLELPLGQVLTLVIFGLLKKGVLVTIRENPLTVQAAEGYDEDATKNRRTAGKKGTVIHDYEHPFLVLLRSWRGSVAECDLNKPLKHLIVTTASAMKGFNLEETREYYRRIVTRAWTEASTIGTLPERQEAVERNFDWLLLDPDWTGKFSRWETEGRVHRPRWTQTHSTGGTIFGGGGGTASSGPPAGSSGGGTSLGEVASSFAGWMETTSSGMASSIQPAALDLVTPRGLVDLSAVDHVTGKVLDALAEASKNSGGGRGGGGCACACAGCACACACAGGGR